MTQMEKKLVINDDKSHWTASTDGYLLSRLMEEMSELTFYLVCEKKFRGNEIIRECADIANFAMMIADKTRR